jgi:hypothetical protein
MGESNANKIIEDHCIEEDPKELFCRGYWAGKVLCFGHESTIATDLPKLDDS